MHQDTNRAGGWVRLGAAAVLAAALLAGGCGGRVRVTTQAAPGVRFGEFRTFHILTPPPRRDGRSGRPDDLMLVNSITSRALRTNIADALIARGYALDDMAPTFTVAYYASSREKLDIDPAAALEE